MEATVVRCGAVWCRHDRFSWGLTAGGTPADACLPRERTVEGKPQPAPSATQSSRGPRLGVKPLRLRFLVCTPRELLAPGPRDLR
jgi:hypothetical protein